MVNRKVALTVATVASALVLSSTPNANAMPRPHLKPVVTMHDGHKAVMPKVGQTVVYEWDWHREYSLCTGSRKYKRNNYGPMILRNKRTHVVVEDDTREGLPKGWQVAAVCTGKIYKHRKG